MLRERNLIKSVSPSACVPQILCTCADGMHAGILLNSYLACPLASIIHTPLDEQSARFCAASIVAALEDLHQLVDFRFGKHLSGNRTFTICGMADYLAPEIVQGKGHGFPADWWALGVLIYFMLQGEMPFGSWRESEVDIVAKIAKGQLNLPQTLSPEAVDLLTKLLVVDENTRLGSQGPISVKTHPWFSGIDWKGIADSTSPVPHEIMSRISQYLEIDFEDSAVAQASPPQVVEELNVPEWLDDW